MADNFTENILPDQQQSVPDNFTEDTLPDQPQSVADVPGQQSMPDNFTEDTFPDQPQDVATDLLVKGTTPSGVEFSEDPIPAERSDGKISIYNPETGLYHWIAKEKEQEARDVGLIVESKSEQVARYNQFPEPASKARGAPDPLSDEPQPKSNLNPQMLKSYYDPETDEHHWIDPKKEFEAKQYGFIPDTIADRVFRQREEDFQETKSQFDALSSGALRSMTYGITDFVVDPWLSKRLKEEYPVTNTIGEIVGLINPIGAPGLVARGASMGARAATKLVAKEAANAASKGIVKTGLGIAGRGAAHGVNIGVVRSVSDIALYGPDEATPKKIAGKIAGDAALGAIFSVGTSAVFHGGKKLLGKLVSDVKKVHPEKYDNLLILEAKAKKLKATRKTVEKKIKSLSPDRRVIAEKLMKDIKKVEDISLGVRRLKSITPIGERVINEGPESLFGKIKSEIVRISNLSGTEDKLKEFLNLNKKIEAKITGPQFAAMNKLEQAVLYENQTNVSRHVLRVQAETLGIYSPTTHMVHIDHLDRAIAITNDELSTAYTSTFSNMGKGFGKLIGSGFAAAALLSGNFEKAITYGMGSGYGAYYVAKAAAARFARFAAKKLIEHNDGFGMPGLGANLGKMIGAVGPILKDGARFSAIKIVSEEAYKAEMFRLENMDTDLIYDSAVAGYVNAGMPPAMAIGGAKLRKQMIAYKLKKGKIGGRFAMSKAEAAFDMRGVASRISTGDYTKEDLEFMKIGYPEHFNELYSFVKQLERFKNELPSIERKFIDDVLGTNNPALMMTIQGGHNAQKEQEPPKKKNIKISNSASNLDRIDSKGLGSKA